MKHLMLLVVTLSLSIIAFASPKVGDMATYSGEGTALGTPIKFLQEVKLTEYDSASNKFKRVLTTTQEGTEPVVVEEWVDAATIPSEVEVNYVLIHCSELNGFLEVVSVKAGQFKTCNLPTEPDMSLNMGHVPFALIRVTGSGWTMELNSYKWGH